LYAKKYQQWLLGSGYIGNSVSKMDTSSPNICGPKISVVADSVKVGLESLKSQLEVVQNGVQSVKKDVEGVKAALD
jgi:hypothetical protein